MTCVLPHRSLEGRMTCRECPGCTLAMDPYLAEFGVTFFLHEIVADLINQLQFAAKHVSKSLRHLFKDDQAIDDREVAARSDCVQVVSVVLRLWCEIAQVDIRGDLWLFSASELEVISCQAMAPATR